MADPDSRGWFEQLRSFKEQHKDDLCRGRKEPLCGLGECPMVKEMS